MAVEPTEPAALAAASLLAASTVDEQGGQAGISAWPGQAQLAGLVQQAVTDRRDLAVVLDDVTARPQDPAAVGALAQVLAAAAAQDPGFRDALARLVGQAEHDSAIGELATTIAGHARVGKVVTIGHAGAVHVHLPPPPAQTVLDRLHRATSGGPLVANLSPRNPAFTGRDELLDQLHETLHPGQAAAVVQVQAQALHGLGGVGKTQLALEYAHAADYDLIWWITAEQPATVPGQLVALARRLGIPEQADQAETVAVLYDELRGRDRWLLVFDNAEDPADLRPWWPPESGRVLVTSRNPAWGGLATTIALEVLPRGEAVAFLQRRLGRDDPAFDALAEVLGDLPLALEQAAAYLEETATGASDYLGLLSDRARELFQLGRPATTEQTIATIWAVSLDRLREQAPAAEDLLNLLAFLAADDVPRDLPAQHAELLPELLATAVGDPLAYQQAVGALRRYSLVKTSQDGQTLSVHRLVQTVVRHQLDPQQEQQWAVTTLHLVDAVVPGSTDDPAMWPVHARYLPHLLTVVRDPMIVDLHPRTVVRLLARAGGYLRYRVDLDQAGALLEQAVQMAQVRLGHDDLDTAWSLNVLANVRYDQGDLAAARALHERALQIREARLGADHPDTASGLNNLAGVLANQGDLAAARTLFERALQIREARLGADHPDTAISLNNLANVLLRQGDLAAARTLYERALGIYETGLGPDHPTTANSLNNLATVLADQGDLDGARTLHQRALRIYEAGLGPDHPTTANSLNNLALVLKDQGNVAAAQTLHERALTICEAQLGPDHPLTALSLNNLATVLRAQGDLQGARTLHQRALAVREASLGPDHPDTATTLHDLALVLRDQGDLDAAQTLHERALTIYEARLGADHPWTAATLNDLAAVLADQGDLQGARPLLERALAIREARLLGADHPDTVRSRQYLAAVVAALDRQR